MHLKLLAAAGAAALLLVTPARAAASTCCDKKDMPCCQKQDMACCHNDLNAIDILLSMDSHLANPQLNPAPPVRQATDIWFKRPVMINRSILQGHYVIEHDNDRMARGEPCTYIYAYDNQKEPVVRFHCTHLERARASQNIAVLATVPDGSMQKLLEFQFAGETASHGVPSER